MAISIFKRREIVRLLCMGGDLSNRRVASLLGVASGTVNMIASQLPMLGMTWEQLKALGDEAFLAAFIRPPALSRSDRPHPDCLLWHLEMERDKDVTLSLLWEEWHTEHQDGISYPQATRRYKQWLKKQRVSMRKVHHPGESIFVDFAGRRLPIYDRDGHGVRYAEVFVATLGASSYSFCLAVWSQTIPDWILCNVKMLEYFGGVPRIITSDNLKSAVTKVTRHGLHINPTYAEFAEYYDTALVPARVRKPDDKGLVEVAVLIIQRWILAALRHRQFYSLEEANAEILRLLEKFNDKEMKAYKASRRQRYEILDQPALKPLPDTAYEYAAWRLKVRAGDNYHALHEGHYYSVPYAIAQAFVDIRAGSKTIEIIHNGMRVATHMLSNVTGGYTTNPAHLSPNHLQYAEGSPDQLLQWAMAVGSATEKVFQHHLLENRHLANGIRAACAIQKLGRQYGADRLEEVCEYAVRIHSMSHTSILSIFRSKADKRSALDAQVEPQANHANVRGSDYYKQTTGEE
ncbi:MAG: IS21 family transposase [Methylotenera sp.]